jgi:succinyl-CoA synthetase beta subunit
VRCDRVANGVVEAYKNMDNITIPIIVRLQGTNAVEAKKIIDDSGLEVFSAIALQDAADIVSKVLSEPQS